MIWEEMDVGMANLSLVMVIIKLETLETVERMNYGISFSPIDGIYTPIEATYDLMLVMDVPIFDPENIPWKSCLKAVYFHCLNVDRCTFVDPKYNDSNRP